MDLLVVPAPSVDGSPYPSAYNATALFLEAGGSVLVNSYRDATLASKYLQGVRCRRTIRLSGGAGRSGHTRGQQQQR